MKGSLPPTPRFRSRILIWRNRPLVTVTSRYPHFDASTTPMLATYRNATNSDTIENVNHKRMTMQAKKPRLEEEPGPGDPGAPYLNAVQGYDCLVLGEAQPQPNTPGVGVASRVGSRVGRSALCRLE